MIKWFKKRKTKTIQVWVTLYWQTEGIIKTTFVDLNNGLYKWTPKGKIGTFVRAEHEGEWWFRTELEAIDDLVQLKAKAIKPLEEQIVTIKSIPVTPVEWEIVEDAEVQS